MALLPRFRSSVLHPESPGFAGLAAFAAAGLLALVTRGFAGDEEVHHFLTARYLPRHPDLLLSLGGKPLLVFIQAIPAQLGLTAARVTSALATGVSAWAVARVVGRRGSGVPGWGAAGLLLAQPFFLLHMGSVMPEPWAALLVALALLAVAEGKTGRLAWIAAGLPFVRPELAILSLAAGVVILRRRARWLVVLPLPAAVWGIAGSLHGGDPGWVLHQTTLQFYGARSLLHYPQALAWGIGAAVLGLAGAGTAAAIRRPRGATVAAGITVLLLLAVHTWFAAVASVTAGNLRYLAVAAPAFVVLAADGAVALLRRPRRVEAWLGLAVAGVAAFTVWSRPYAGDFDRLAGWDVLPGIAVVLVAVAAWRPRTETRGLVPVLVCVFALATIQIVRGHRHHPPFRATPEQTAIRKATTWVSSGSTPVFTTGHPLVAYRLGRDPWNPASDPRAEAAALELAPPESGFLWESHYGPVQLPRSPLRSFLQDPRWRARRGLVSADSSWAGVWFERLAWPAAPDTAAWVRGVLRVESGVPTARQRAARYPHDLERRLDLARRLAAAGEDAEADAILSQTEATDPDRADVRLFRAERSRIADPGAALALGREVVAAYPGNGEAHFLVGRLLLEVADGNESGERTRELARGHLLTAADRLPRRWDAQYLAAGILLVDDRPGDAERYIRAALRQRPDDAATLLAGARTALGNQDPGLAERRLRRLIRHHPRDRRGYVGLAGLLASRGDSPGASEVLRTGYEATRDSTAFPHPR